MMNIWHDIDEDRIYPTDFVSVIEISKGSNMKYELDKKTGMLALDRVLFTATYYPMNYASFLVHTVTITIRLMYCFYVHSRFSR